MPNTYDPKTDKFHFTANSISEDLLEKVQTIINDQAHGNPSLVTVDAEVDFGG